MSPRKKLNGLYPVVAMLVAAYIGLAVAGITAFNTHAGNTRWAAATRRR